MKKKTNTIRKTAAIAAVMTMAVSTLCPAVSAQTAVQEVSAGTSLSFAEEAKERTGSNGKYSDAALQDLANALDGTLWIGLDGNNTSYAMSFDGVKISLSDNEGKSVKGYWAVSSDTLFVYSDKAMMNEIASYAWDYDTDSDLFVLDGSAYLYLSSAAAADEISEEMDRLTYIGKTTDFLDGTCWISVTGSGAEAFCITGRMIKFVSAYEDGTSGSHTYTWRVDIDKLTIYNNRNKLVNEFDMNISSDGMYIWLTDKDGMNVKFSRVSDDDAAGIIDALSGKAK